MDRASSVRWHPSHMASGTSHTRRVLGLRGLRSARSLTQTQVAESLSLGQPDVSRLERRRDVLVSTLRRFVEATGGELEIVARYGDGDSVTLDLTDE